MKQIIIVGFGNMGQRIAQAIEESSDMEIAYIVKENNQPDMEKLPELSANMQISKFSKN